MQKGKIKMKKILNLIIVLSFILITSIEISDGQPQVVGIGGYVTYADGSPVPNGVFVTIKNNDTGVYDNTTTVGGTGLFAGSFFANDGDEIFVNVSYLGYLGINSTLANLSLVTQWCNITLSFVHLQGYIYFENGSTVPSGVPVTIFNNNTGSYFNDTTNASGFYERDINADNGDLINVNASYGNEWGSNSTIINASKSVQWCNVTMRIGIIPPVAGFSYNPSSPYVGNIVTFTDYSYDPDGWIVSWQWYFGDGHASIKRHPQHIYSNEGEYTVKLIVIDNDGLRDNATKRVQIFLSEDPPPDADIWIPPIQPPEYPEKPYTVPEMYDLMEVDKLKETKGKVKIVVIDTGTIDRIYDGVDMNDITKRHTSDYTTGVDDHGHGGWCNYAVHYGLETWCPNSVQYSIKTLNSEGGCSQNTLLEALDLAEDLNADIISISAGGWGSPVDAISKRISRLRGKGICVFVAAGNYGPAKSTIMSPGCSPSSIAVGAIDPIHTIDDLNDDIVCDWSSRGPVPGIDEAKPDVCSGGESIIGPWLQGERICSGTSMSTPIVAGGGMVIYAKHKQMLDFLKIEYFFYKRIVPNILEESIESTCYEKTDMDSYGNGIPQFDDASNKLFWLALFWILLPFIIIAVVIIVILVLRHMSKKERGEEKEFLYG